MITKRLSSPHEAKSLETSWNDIIIPASKRQRKDIRVVLPFFLRECLRPDDIDQNVLNELCRCLQSSDDDELKGHMPEKHARWTVNSAVNAISDVLDGDITFAPLKGPRDDAEEQHSRFLDMYGVELDQYHAERNINAFTYNAEKNAFRNCLKALEGVGLIPDSLDVLVTPQVRFVLMTEIDKRDRSGSFVQAMRTLAAFSLYCSHEDAEDAHEQFTAAAREHVVPQELPSAQAARLLPYIGRKQFEKLFQQLMKEAQVSYDFNPSQMRRNNRITSAIYSLIAIFAPGSFKTVHGASFVGPPRAMSDGQRPSLKILPYDEGLEKCLDPVMIGIIDRMYGAYARAGVVPAGIMVDRNGHKRPSWNAIASIQTLLKSLSIELTLLDLRELGIAQALRAGDDLNQIARAARLSERAFWNRYREFNDSIKKIKD